MKTELANLLNQDAEFLKLNQYLELHTGVPANFGIVGRQYGYRSTANRAIREFMIRHFPTFPRNVQLWVNQIDDGCYEIDGVKE